MELALGIGTLSLTTIFSLLSIATIVLFLYYGIEWAGVKTKTNSGAETKEAYHERIKTEFSYYATVILLLIVLASMHGYGLIKELL